MMMMIQVGLEEAWISGLWDVWMGIQDLEDRYLGQLRWIYFFIVNSSFWVTIQVGRGEFGFFGLCDVQADIQDPEG